MSSARPLEHAPIEFPESVDGRALLLPTRHSAWGMGGEQGAGYRRFITKDSPLLFAITYLPHWLRMQDSGLMSFAPFHLDVAESMRSWPAGGARDAWVGPRGLAKTMWLFGIGPLWALAHGHRRFCVAFSYSEDQAVGHLSTTRQELDGNDLLLHDFAELRPKRARGARNTLTTVTASGATLAARGLGGTSLGIRSGADRPDLIVGDDLEPSESDYSPAAKVKLQHKLTDGVLRMGSRDAVVALTGTVTMRGSMIHDVVRTAKGEPGAPSWVRDRGIRARYYPPVTAAGVSVWPQRWSIAELDAERARDPREYALNMANDPSAETVTYWTRDSFRYDERFRVASRVLHLDVAVTRRASSDFTVLALVALDVRGRACVERVQWGRWTLDEIRNRIADFCEPLQVKPRVQVEGNQGGDTWLDSLAPWPAGVRFEIVTARAPKRVRIAKGYNHYQRRAVVHAWPMPELEAALCEWPRGVHDDVPDAVAGALEGVFG